ncbi:MAG: DNA polymerase/3'-5' exonuclease PolX [Pedobacter sp.]|nr:DNA polymerase/3'-5' exonuclease PolX [Chitinophagaceae bacterium]
MDNYAIAENFSMLGKLMDIHGENSFKTKSYSMAAYTIEKLPSPLAEMPATKVFAIRGIGEAIGKKIIEQIETGELQILTDYFANTPPGIVEMLKIKGLGPKKIATIWKDLEVETLGELLYACNENRLMLYKGFGEKTQQNVKEGIEFYLGTLGSYLYQQIEHFAGNVSTKMQSLFPQETFVATGDFKRQIEVIEKLEWVTTINKNSLTEFLTSHSFDLVDDEDNYVSFVGKENVTLGFYCTDEKHFYSQLFTTSCSDEFLNKWNETVGWNADITYQSEEEIFAKSNISFIPAFQRETAEIIDVAKLHQLPKIIIETDIKGIIHSHSKWSDGTNTLEEMSKAAMAKGYEYLVISDHSKTAFYAQGLPVEKVIAQHQQIDELNAKIAPFKIFKSIESDILGDGSLDYDNNILNSFDIVIASIHSNLKMTEEKAMLRLINAIENPYTSILGHMTGRLLLSRAGYPVNHIKIIDACAANNVVIELNAHPRRLDIDWRWIKHALNKNVLLSINPDAHNIEGYNDCRFGVLVAQKAGLTSAENLSSYNLQQFEAFVKVQKQKR